MNAVLSKLSGRELKELSHVQQFRTVFVLLLDWLVLLALVVVAARVHNPLVWILVFFAVARQQHALAILMHEACHFRLFQSRTLNDWVGHWLCSAPLFFSLKTYRSLHFVHHNDPMGPTDPDLAITGGYPIPRASFRRKITRDLTGRSFLKIVRFYTFVPPHLEAGAPWWARHPRTSGALANAAIFVLFALLAGPFYYVVFWLLPLSTLLPLMLRIRAITEHAGYSQNADQSQNARTLLRSWQTWILAPHAVHFHIEHHLYPSIPYFSLSQAHRLLNERRCIPADHQFRSYSDVVKSLLLKT